MPNALQDFMRGIASGSFNITAPYFQAQAAGQRNNAQQLAQRQLAERIRQFNGLLPIQQQTANAGALAANTAASKYSNRQQDLDAKTKAGLIGNIGGALQQYGDVTGIGAVHAQIGQPQGLPETVLPAIEKDARGKRVGQVGAEAAERAKYAQKTAKYKSDLKGKSDPILRRQLVNRVAQAREQKLRLETEIAKLAGREMDPSMADYFNKAKEQADFNIYSASRIYEAMTGEQPNEAEINSVLQGGAAPQQQPGTVDPRAEAIRRAIQGSSTSTTPR